MKLSIFHNLENTTIYMN